jgi:hypothetical protein
MSRGLGRVQRDCLRIITEYEKAGKPPTTYNIVAEVYQVQRDENGNRRVTDAQHVAVKRALGVLRRQGRVIGWHDSEHTPYAAGDRKNGHIERCHYWRLASPT